jgi:PKHD-type hydroxylase
MHGAYKRYIYGVTKAPLKPDGNIPSGFTTYNKFIGKVRKLSMTINLCDESEYEGGDLKFDFGLHKSKSDRFHVCEEIRPKGSIVIFPSFVQHCVTPITKGTRYSLVMWTLGEPWK